MPDTDLDTRIRELVARAVADAPAPPVLDPATTPSGQPGGDQRRWWLGGGVAALVAAAAAVVAFILVSPSDDAVQTPATAPTTSVAPTPTLGPAPSVPDPSIPATAPPAAGPQTTAGVPPVPGRDEVILTAGPDGVVERRGERVRTLTDEPTAIALATPDGRVLVQQPTGEGVSDAPLVLDPADGSTTPLFDTGEWDGLVRLHDVELVGDRQLLVFSVISGTDDPVASDEAVFVVDLATGERTEIVPAGEVTVMDRLTLAPSGLVVGGVVRDNAVAFFVVAVPGSAADQAPLPTAEQLGLADSYPGCDLDCPRGFTVLADGRTFAWVAADNQSIVVTTLGGGDATTIPLPFPPQGGLDSLAGTSSFLLARSSPDVRAMQVDADGTVFELDGGLATAGPAAVLPGG